MKLKYKVLLTFIVLVAIQCVFSIKSNASTVQNAIWFMDNMYVTQVPDGDYSHKGTMNFDVIGYNGNNNIFAPFDCKIVAIYPAPNSGNTVVIESLSEVQYADGTIGYMSMAFAHDNNISDLYIGRVIKQGEVFYQTGNYGVATGIHSHVTCIRGKYQGDMWTVNSHGNSCSPNAIHPTTALSITKSTNIIQTMGMDFKMCFELEANIVPYRPSTLTWNEVEGAAFYRIQGTLNGVGYCFENPDFRSCQQGAYWETTETSYTRTLAAGDYTLYIEAYDNERNIIKTSNEIPVSIKDVEIQFKDSKFEEYIKQYIKRNNSLHAYNSKFIENGIFTFNDLPRDLPISYGDYASYEDCTLPPDSDCTIYFFNEDGTKNYKIEKYECIRDDYRHKDSYKAKSFKALDGMSSIKEIHIQNAVDEHIIFDNLSEFLGYFPNTEKIHIYYLTPENWNILENFKKLKDLVIYINGTQDDIKHISKVTSLTELNIWNNNNSELDFSAMSNLKNLKTLYIGNTTIKDGKVNIPSLEILDFTQVTLTGNNFINGFSNLKKLCLEANVPEKFSINNTSLKEISCFRNYSNCIVDGMFDGTPNLESLEIFGYRIYDGVIGIEFNWDSLSKLTNLKRIYITDTYIDKLDFLAKLTKLETIDLSNIKDAKSLGNLENLLNLKEIYICGSDISDVSGLLNVAKKGNLKNVSMTENKSLNPNSKKNQPVFDILNSKGIKYRVDNYWLKDFIDTTIIHVKDINMQALGTIGMFSASKATKVEDLITEKNFPILETYDINVITHSGQGKKLGENVGSRDKVQVVNSLGEILKEYIVVVPGDVTGNGLSKIYDSFKILNDVVKGTKIDELDVEIRDYNDDGNVKMYDALQYLKDAMTN